MTISDSVPIQFWVNGQETFNEKQICGVNQVCFCLPFNCDDEITIQIQEDLGNEFDLVIYDVDDVELGRVEFDEYSDGVYQVSVTPSELSPSICEKVFFKIESTVYHILYDYELDNVNQAFTSRDGLGANYGVSPNGRGWSQTENLSFLGSVFPNGVWRYAPPDMEGNLGGSLGQTNEVLFQIFETEITTSELKLDITTTTYSLSYNNPVTITITYSILSGQTVIATQTQTIVSDGASPDSGNLNATLNFGAVEDATEIRIHMVKSGSATVWTLDNLDYTKLDLYAENYAVFESDCIDLRTSHDCTVLLAYTNSTDFDGIIYEGSPQPTFYLRIPAQFWKENNPMTQEDSELSNGVIVTRRQSIQEKTLLEIGYIPNYLHKKIQKILMHETVTINGQVWKRRDEYEAENIKDYPLKRGTVWLTKYNSVEKNTI